MSRSEARRSEDCADTRMRKGSASSMRFVVNGMIKVEGCPASSSACAWTISTGRVLPGSVPRRGFRLASQTSPRSGIRVALDSRELGVHPHAFLADLPGRARHPLGAGAGFGLAVHPLDRAADVFGPRDAECLGAARAGFEQLFRQLQRDRFHNMLSKYPLEVSSGSMRAFEAKGNPGCSREER